MYCNFETSFLFGESLDFLSVILLEFSHFIFDLFHLKGKIFLFVELFEAFGHLVPFKFPPSHILCHFDFGAELLNFLLVQGYLFFWIKYFVPASYCVATFMWISFCRD